MCLIKYKSVLDNMLYLMTQILDSEGKYKITKKIFLFI